jgi:hypothetical protein
MSGGIVAHFNPSRIPDYLKQRPQWIAWGKRTKQYNIDIETQIGYTIFLIICSGQDL